ncbi:MAG: MBL fold metallo-hydrolase [bacterium]|nr:MBL fold metallo-hydrolase [bacterium]
MRKSSKVLGAAILILLALVICIWYTVFREDRGGLLTISFLNIGQGDSIFIDAPSGRQVLIDGGPNASVIRELGKVMPWYDRTIDVMIPTHPDADHIGGLVDVLTRYKVGMIIQSSVEGSTALWDTLEREVHKEGALVLTARRGQIVDLGSTGSPQAAHAYLEVLFPDRDVPNLETNTGCVVTRLVYGNTSFMLPCDAPQAIEKYLTSLDGSGLHSDVLKAGHHGSKTSSAPLFVGYVDPTWAVYSRGCDNRYGHPNKETVETFSRFQIPTLDTCTEGTITFVSDGSTVKLR